MFIVTFIAFKTNANAEYYDGAFVKSKERSKSDDRGYLDNTLFFHIAYSNLSQNMNEHLYDNQNEYLSGHDYEVSELNWRNHYTSLLTLGLEWRPNKELSIGLITSFNIRKRGNGQFKMDDYD